MRNRIPLEERFQRLESGYPSDPDYILCALKKMAQTPICIYLSGLDGTLETLIKLLGVSHEDAATMTYRDAAAHIVRLRIVSSTKGLADEAAELLALPLYNSYEERKELYAPIQTDSA